MRLFRLVWTWPVQHVDARYHELQLLIAQELEQKDNIMQENPINRRNVLHRLASLPIEMYGLSLVVPTPPRFPEELLLHTGKMETPGR